MLGRLDLLNRRLDTVHYFSKNYINNFGFHSLKNGHCFVLGTTLYSVENGTAKVDSTAFSPNSVYEYIYAADGRLFYIEQGTPQDSLCILDGRAEVTRTHIPLIGYDNTLLHADSDYVYIFRGSYRSVLEPRLFLRNGLHSNSIDTIGSINFSQIRGCWSIGFVNDRILFSISHDTLGFEPWFWDLKSSQIGLLKNINPWMSASSIDWSGRNSGVIATNGSRMYFFADDAVHGKELWESSGTEEDTRLVDDTSPGASWTNISGLGSVYQRLFFAASDSKNHMYLYEYKQTPTDVDVAYQGNAIARQSVVYRSDRLMAYRDASTDSPGEIMSYKLFDLLGREYPMRVESECAASTTLRVESKLCPGTYLLVVQGRTSFRSSPFSVGFQ